MTQAQITSLLDKFYAGTSTVAEEQTLRRYFAAEDCPPELEADRQTVLALSTPAAVEVPADLEKRIVSRLRPRRRPRVRLVYRLSAAVTTIAAAVLLAFVLFAQKAPAPTVYADTCTSPEQAAEQTRAILVKMSEDLNLSLEADDNLGGPCS